MSELVDPWRTWRQATRARVGLGRTGSSMTTDALLAFQLDHARARDAVHDPLDVDALRGALETLSDDVRTVASAATDRATYLLRPDLGRRLDEASSTALRRVDPAPDIVFVLADGLSARGVAHAPALLAALLPRLEGLVVGPLVVATQARVALGDDVGERLGARMVVVLIGERPGLSSPDSLGAYLTFAPRVGRHDAERNCLSNIRPEGLVPEAAAIRLAWLIRASLSRRLSGVDLKDDSALLTHDRAAT